MEVGILGGGRWGQALGHLVKTAGHEPFVAIANEGPPEGFRWTDQPREVAEACDLLLVAVSGSQVREAIRATEPSPGNRIVVAGRGLEPSTGTPLTEVVRQECDAVRIGALGGPAPADEILHGGIGAGVVASAFEEVRELAIRALNSRQYRLYETEDALGVQMAAASMPVLAAMLGLADSMGDARIGVRALVMARGLAELGRLATAHGADQEMLYGLAGMGELYAVHARPGARYFEAGKALSEQSNVPGPWRLARALLRMGHAKQVELPLTEALVQVLDGASPSTIARQLLRRGWESANQAD